MDNGKQFDYATFRDFSTQLGTNLCFSSVYLLQSNGAVERTNDIIFAGIKKNITELPKGKWVDELPRVIWSHNTTESRDTKFTQFKLLYGEEAVTPEEIKFKSWRTAKGADTIEEDIKPSIDMIEAGKMQAAINLGKNQEETRRWKNKNVKPMNIKEGDLVLRRIPKAKQKGKMYNKWEGPFIVSSMARQEACRLRTLEGTEDPYSWNKDMLQKYYV